MPEEQKIEIEDKESSLTSLSDRNLEKKWKPEESYILTREETVDAVEDLNNSFFTKNYPSSDRTYADPYLQLQKIGLVSFMPSKGATPDKDGIFGFAKLRGNFDSEIEANQRAEFIIKNVDSYHKIFHAYVGRPFPITNLSTFSKEKIKVDLKNQGDETVRESMKTGKKEDKQVIKEIKEREQELLDDTNKKGVDPFERYTEICVKKAQLTWTYMEKIRALKTVKKSILNSRKELSELDEEYPEFRNKYFTNYCKAREDAGFSDTTDTFKSSFLKYMVEDFEKIQGIDTETINLEEEEEEEGKEKVKEEEEGGINDDVTIDDKKDTLEDIKDDVTLDGKKGTLEDIKETLVDSIGSVHKASPPQNPF